MSDFTTLKEACYDTVVGIVTDYVDDPHTHIIAANDDDQPEQPPMVALNADTRSDQRGFYGSRVVSIETNPYDVVYGNDRIFTLDVTISDVNGDRADNIYDGVFSAFDSYDGRIRDPQQLVGDEGPRVDNVEVSDQSPLTRDGRVGHALAIEIDYTRRFRHSDIEDPPTPVTTVVQNFVEGDTVYESYETT